MKYILDEMIDIAKIKSDNYNGGLIYIELSPDTNEEGSQIYRTEGGVNMPNYEAITTATAHIVKEYMEYSGLDDRTALTNLLDAVFCLE